MVRLELDRQRCLEDVQLAAGLVDRRRRRHDPQPEGEAGLLPGDRDDLRPEAAAKAAVRVDQPPDRPLHVEIAFEQHASGVRAAELRVDDPVGLVGVEVHGEAGP
jgi:hypothetical protein